MAGSCQPGGERQRARQARLSLTPSGNDAAPARSGPPLRRWCCPQAARRHGSGGSRLSQGRETIEALAGLGTAAFPGMSE